MCKAAMYGAIITSVGLVIQIRTAIGFAIAETCWDITVIESHLIDRN
jgi:hypothetical protein